METINLISDTVTKPSRDMLEVMMRAEVGDDVFGEDPSVNRLQQRMAEMFGKEAALFCPSGTMTNQIAIKVHTQPLDEVICDESSHIYQSETGGYAFNSGVAINLIQGQYGKINAQQIDNALKFPYDWHPISKLVVIENTCNKGGGSYYTLDEIKPIHQLCTDKGLKLHLDGARLFNALVETGESTKDWGSYFDSISICLSKGLGAPVGSVLIGTHKDIHQARRYRKVMGGGMRQAGYLAAACEYAIDNNINQLQIDNERARHIGKILQDITIIEHVKPVHTNIVIFKLKSVYKDSTVIQHLKNHGILAVPFGDNTVRFVFHMDITKEMYERLTNELEKIISLI